MTMQEKEKEYEPRLPNYAHVHISGVYLHVFGHDIWHMTGKNGEKWEKVRYQEHTVEKKPSVFFCKSETRVFLTYEENRNLVAAIHLTRC